MPQTSFTNINAKDGFVYLNDRIPPTEQRFWNVPANLQFVITDIVAQNRAPGDAPVQPAQFTRFSFISPANSSVFFLVLGHQTFSEHFTTGLPVPNPFQFSNVANSSAPFVDVVITGFLRPF